jgi:hypothetical protein
LIHRRVELVVVRITITISIARQGPSDFSYPPSGGPAPGAPRSRPDQRSNQNIEYADRLRAILLFVLPETNLADAPYPIAVRESNLMQKKLNIKRRVGTVKPAGSKVKDLAKKFSELQRLREQVRRAEAALGLTDGRSGRRSFDSKIVHPFPRPKLVS